MWEKDMAEGCRWLGTDKLGDVEHPQCHGHSLRTEPCVHEVGCVLQRCSAMRRWLELPQK